MNRRSMRDLDGLDRRPSGGRMAAPQGAVALAEILGALRPEGPDPGGIAIGGIAGNAAAVQPGDLYVALQASEATIAEAVSRGAAAVVAECPTPAAGSVPRFRVQDALRALGHLVDRLQDRPSTALSVLAVVGGAEARPLAASAVASLAASGFPAAALAPRRLGGPGSLELQRHLAEARTGGHRSSILDLVPEDLVRGRLEGIRLRGALVFGIEPRPRPGFPTVEGLLEACLDLARGLPADARLILDGEDPFSELLRSESRAEPVEFGFDRRAGIRARFRRRDAEGCLLEIQGPFGLVPLQLPVQGDLGLRRHLAAFTLAVALGGDPGRVAAEISRRGPRDLVRLAVPAPYRIVLSERRGRRGLEDGLRTLRPLVPGRLVAWLRLPAPKPGGRSGSQALRLAAGLADEILVTSGPGGSPPLAPLRSEPGVRARVRAVDSSEQALDLALGCLGPRDALFLPGARPADADSVRAWFLRGLLGGAVDAW